MAGNFGSENFEDRRVESIMQIALVREKYRSPEYYERNQLVVMQGKHPGHVVSSRL